MISSEHFSELQAEEMLSPRGPERGDIHAAQIVAAIMNAFGDGKNPVRIRDVIIKFRKQRQSPEEMKAQAKAWVMGMASRRG